MDLSPLRKFEVTGPDAEELMQMAVTRNMKKLSVGQVVYTAMCYEHGGVVDDLLVYKKADDDYLICLNASNTEKDVAWLKSKLSGFDAKLVDVSDDFALLALQGPKALEILSGLTSVDLGSLNYYWFTEGGVAGKPCIISRTGYTGEQGVERSWERMGAAQGVGEA